MMERAQIHHRNLRLHYHNKVDSAKYLFWFSLPTLPGALPVYFIRMLLQIRIPLGMS